MSPSDPADSGAPGPPAAAAAPDPPAVWTVPLPPNPFLTGRADLLTRIHRALAGGKVEAVALHGLGGVGKTQAAAAYAHAHQGEYDAVLWVAAGSAAAIESNLAALALPLGLPEAGARELAVAAQAVRRWLADRRRWLLVLDSADSPGAAAAARALAQAGGHTLITSRITQWPPAVKPFPVAGLKEPQAIEFLTARTRDFPGAGSPAEAKALARELDGLPLALEQAAACVLRHRVTLAEYLGRLKRCRQKLLGERSEGATDYPRSLAETWMVSEPQLPLAARAILRLVAFLAADNVPCELFANPALLAEAIGLLAAETAGSAGDAPADPEPALEALAEHSLIARGPAVFSCHRLVQAVQADRTPREHQRTWVDLAVRLLGAAAPQQPADPGAWPLWGLLGPHAETLLGHGPSDTQATSDLRARLSLYRAARAS